LFGGLISVGPGFVQMLFVCLEVFLPGSVVGGGPNTLATPAHAIMAERRMERAAPGRNETGFCFPMARLHGALSTVLAGLWWASRQTSKATSRQTNSPIYLFFVSCWSST